MDRRSASQMFEALELNPSDRLLDTFLSLDRQLSSSGLLPSSQCIRRSVLAELSLRKLAMQFDYDAFLHRSVLQADSASKSQQERKRGDYFAAFETAKRVLGVEFIVDGLLINRATLLFDRSVVSQAEALRHQFEEQLHRAAHKNSAHLLVAALLVVVGVAKIEDLRPLLDLAKLDLAGARKLATALKASYDVSAASNDRKGAASQEKDSSSSASQPRKKPRLEPSTSNTDFGIHAHEQDNATPITAMSEIECQSQQLKHDLYTAVPGLAAEENQHYNEADWQRRAYELWRQQALL